MEWYSDDDFLGDSDDEGFYELGSSDDESYVDEEESSDEESLERCRKRPRKSISMISPNYLEDCSTNGISSWPAGPGQLKEQQKTKESEKALP